MKPSTWARLGGACILLALLCLQIPGPWNLVVLFGFAWAWERWVVRPLVLARAELERLRARDPSYRPTFGEGVK